MSTTQSISIAASKSNTNSNFFSFDIDRFVTSLCQTYRKTENIRLGPIANSYLRMLLGRLTITDHGIILTDQRYDSLKNMAESIDSCEGTVSEVEAGLVEVGLIEKKTTKHKTNPFKSIRIITLSEKLKNYIKDYVKAKKANKLRGSARPKLKAKSTGTEVNLTSKGKPQVSYKKSSSQAVRIVKSWHKKKFIDYKPYLEKVDQLIAIYGYEKVAQDWMNSSFKVFKKHFEAYYKAGTVETSDESHSEGSEELSEDDLRQQIIVKWDLYLKGMAERPSAEVPDFLPAGFYEEIKAAA